MEQTRRRLLAAAAAGLASLAGCAGSPAGSSSPSSEQPTNTTDSDVQGPAPPTVQDDRLVSYDVSKLRSDVRSGGVPKDGIPPIDEPEFTEAEDADVPGGDPVFGVVRDGEAKAYPQYILVHHEIVNDVIGGDPVSVTYCPLTGTAQGFERGDTTFGVSGDLLNANLVMYDRGTDSRWPQMLATAIEGPLEGATLDEFRVVWTTWRKWNDAHPDTSVLTENTGYVRPYDDDPYGSYNPRRRYYDDDNFLFPPLAEDDRADPKDVVVGARTATEAVAFDRQSLREERVLTADGADVSFVAVVDQELDAGYVYESPEGVAVEPTGDSYQVDGDAYGATELPLDGVLAYDAMWFAWAGYYPETEYVA